MRELAAAQEASGLYVGVGVGVLTDRDWPQQHQSDLQGLGVLTYRAPTPKMFGTASFLWQRLRKPPIADWITDVTQRCQAQEVIAHFHNAWMSGVFLPLPEQKHCRLASVATFHGVNAFLDRQPIRHRLHHWMAQRLIRYGATLTSVDTSNLARAEAIFAIPPHRFQVVPNGTTTTSARACPFLGGAASFTVGHVGSLTPQKGWHIAVQAVLLSAKAGVRCRMIIAGAGPDEPQVRELAEANPGLIEFRGYVNGPRENLMPELDLLAVMSSHEGLPMSAVEALSIGLPIAATCVGGMAEVVADRKTGYLVKREAVALQQVITRLADDRQRLRQLSHECLEQFRSRFEISRIVDAYQTVYESALSTQ